MPCVPTPALPLPTIPDGITLAAPMPALPGIGLQAPCCLLPPYTPPLPPIPNPVLKLGGPAIVAAKRAIRKAIEDYDDLIPLECGRT